MHIDIRKRIPKPILLIMLFCISFTLLGPSIVLGQTNTVSGTVADRETGQPLVGVNILIKGTSIGTATNASGHYSLQVENLQDTLRISYVGYKTKMVPINGRTSINVALEKATQGLSELVVVGFGAQSKKNLSTSVARISADELETPSASQALQGLQGKLSGVSIRQTSGKPGGGIKIRIRGAASLSTSSAPLYVVDGVPISGGIGFLNSNMIESISVLKGAAAAALYGSRASNGVVLIQTKTAEGNEVTLNFSSNVGMQRVPKARNIDVMNAREFATFQKYIAEVNGRPVPDVVQNPAQYGEGTNWQRLIQRTALFQKYNMSIGIGGDNFSTMAMGGFTNQQGVIIGSHYKRYSLRINSSFQPIKKLEIGLSIAPSYEINSTSYAPNDREDVIGLSRLVSPLVSPYKSDGSLRMVIDDGVSFTQPNPLLIAKQRKTNNRNLHLLASGSVKYDLFKGFSIKTVASVEMNRGRGFHFSPTSDGTYGNIPPTIPSSNTSYSRLYNWRSATSLTYKTDIGKHSIDLLGVFIAQKERALGNGISATQYPLSNKIKTINIAGKISASNYYGAWTLLSYIGRLNYSYANKYLLQVSLRRDGSSRFGSKNKWGYFPSVSAGWIISNEDFWNIEPISFLKVRASYGVTGNFEIGNYTYLQNIGTSFYTFGKGLSQARYINNISDKGLGWEKTKSYGVGLDISLFNNRISLTYDYYHKKTTNLLYSVSVPSASGFNNLQTNIGAIEFWGHELSISGQVVASSNWSWDTNFNISFSNNKVLALGTQNHVLYGGWVDGLTSGTNITKVGSSVGMLYGMKYIGLYNNKDELQNNPAFDKSVVGSTRYKDTNGDGELNSDDAIILGNPRPDFRFGITNNISYKNFNLSIVIAGTYGNKVMALYQNSLVNLDGVFNVLESVKYQWRGPQNPGKGYWPSSKAGNTNLIRDYPNSTMVHDATHLNIENITLGYTFQLNSNSITNLKMYVSMQNVLFFSYLRTESSGSSTHLDDTGLGIIRQPYPVPRTITFGVNIGL